MSKHQRVIEINGRKYDAGTGRPVASHQSRPSTAHHRGSIDGVIGGKPKAKPNAHHASKTPSKPQASREHQAKHIQHHKTQKSRSLMRHAVQKPAVKPTPPAVPAKVNSDRAERALSVPMSAHISRFGGGDAHTKHKPRFEPLPITKHPEEHKAQEPKHHSPPVTHQVKQHVSASQKHFEAALSKAHAHEQKPTKKQKRGSKLSKKLGISRSMVNVSALVVAFLLLGGFFAYQNVANISMRLAATRAGFDAQLPDYRPTGFALSGPIEYGPGFVNVNFGSNSDDRSFEIKQQVSNWNSVALAENYLGTENKQYQTYSDKGKTIYIYDDANATWVSGGVWYIIENHNVLTDEQLLKLASSI